MRIYQLSPNQPPAAPQAHLPTVYVSRSDAWEYHVLDVPADELPAQGALNQLGSNVQIGCTRLLDASLLVPACYDRARESLSKCCERGLMRCPVVDSEYHPVERAHEAV